MVNYWGKYTEMHGQQNVKTWNDGYQLTIYDAHNIQKRVKMSVKPMQKPEITLIRC